MNVWLILAAYAVGYVWTARTVALRTTESEAQRELRHRNELRRYGTRETDDRPLVDTENRVMNLVLGAIVAFVWPIAILVIAIAPRLKVPTEIAEAERRELAALRKLAAENNLPMPQEDA